MLKNLPYFRRKFTLKGGRIFRYYGRRYY